MRPLLRSSILAAFLLAALSSARAATLVFTVTNLAPADSVQIDPVFYLTGSQSISDVSLNSSGTGNAVLPQLGYFVSSDTTPAAFSAGGSPLPSLLPGDSLTFTLDGIDLTLQDQLNSGIGLYFNTAIASGGVLTGTTSTFSAGSLALFGDPGDGSSRLTIPNSPSFGPSTILSSTPLIRLTISNSASVPEPSRALLILLGSALPILRRRRARTQ